MDDIWLLPATFLCSFLGTWLIIYLSVHSQWFDTPNERSSHASPTPTSGGVAIFAVFAIAVLVAFHPQEAGFNPYTVLFLAFCIALAGLLDDINHLGIGIRIGVQAVVVAGAMAQFGLPVLPLAGFVVDAGWAGYPLALLFFLWFINLFNFMDGIDGLAAMETVFICAAVFLIAPDGEPGGTHYLLLLLAAAVSGFLVLNVAPARIFMGDVGSNVLGYLLIVAALGSTRAGLTNAWPWLILAGVFIVDATYTLVARMAGGETWYHAHRSHAYQLAAARLGGHGKVVLGVLMINVFWLLPLAWLAQRFPAWGAAILVVAWFPLFCLVRLIRRRMVVPGTVQP